MHQGSILQATFSLYTNRPQGRDYAVTLNYNHTHPQFDLSSALTILLPLLYEHQLACLQDHETKSSVYNALGNTVAERSIPAILPVKAGMQVAGTLTTTLFGEEHFYLDQVVIEGHNIEKWAVAGPILLFALGVIWEHIAAEQDDDKHLFFLLAYGWHKWRNFGLPTPGSVGSTYNMNNLHEMIETARQNNWR